MKEAHDHHRVTTEGKRLGEQLARLAQKSIDEAASKGLEDSRCKTCAFRPGTVPNGCPQTGMDALKAVMEGVPFLCHQDKREYCYGWLTARASLYKAGAPKVTKMPYDFSPPDPTE